MKHIDIFRVFCKVFGMYFTIQILLNIKDTFFFGVVNELYDNNQSDFYYFLGGQVFNILFNGLAAWILIVKTNLLTSVFFKDSSEKFDLTVTKSDLIEVTIIGICTIIILEAIPDFFHKIVYYVYFNPYDKNEKELFWTSKTRADIFYFGFKFVVGLVIILNYRLIAKRLIRIGDKEDQIENDNK